MKRLALLLTTLLCLTIPAVAFAASQPFNPLGDACTSDTGAKVDASACNVDSTKDPLTGPNGILKKVSLFIAVLGGIVAVVLLIISGFRYVLANGDAQKAAQARSSIIGAVVGIIIIATAETVIVFVVNKL